jgi:putative SOS response-associated peptidase YedK
MSRLYTVMASVPEVAAHFGVEPVPEIEKPTEVTEGLPGLVVYEKAGRRIMKALTWGFPRLTREMRVRGDPPGVIGLVADVTNPMWDQMVVEPRYRCLIPITHFANPDGVPGAKTRTWFSLKDQPIAAWAGFCRNLLEGGPVYAGITMEANEAVPPTNDRMPVLLAPHEYERWLHGSIKDVIEFQLVRPPVAADRMLVERTDDLWRSHGLPTWPPQMQLL